jgi:hypothetical protein
MDVYDWMMTKSQNCRKEGVFLGNFLLLFALRRPSRPPVKGALNRFTKHLTRLDQ